MAGNRTLALRLLANTQDFTNKMRAAGGNTNKLSAKFKTLAKAGALAFAGLAAAAGAAAIKIGGDALNAAVDFEEAINKSRVIFGDSADAIEKWSETAATAFGQSQKQAIDAASTFATFGKAAGLTDKPLVKFSTQLTELSSDLASFYNTSPDEAITAIGAALRGESEPIRKYGVLLNDATLKAEAMKMGLYSGTGVLDQQAKVLAAYEVILKQTTDAQGDFARTSDGIANSQRTLTAIMDDLKVQIGQALAPTFEKFVTWMKTDGITAIQTFIDVLTGKEVTGDEWTAKNGKIEKSFSPAAEAGKNMAESIREVGKQFGKLFDELEIENPNGKFWSFVNGVADLVGLFAKLMGEPGRLKKVSEDSGLFSFTDPSKFLDALRNGWNNRPGVQGSSVLSMNAMPRSAGTNIIINGAIDPLATAKAVSNALNYAPLRGAVTTQIRPI